MTGVRFYHEFLNPRRTISAGTVIAVAFNNCIPPTDELECISAVYYEPNSPVASGAVSQSFLRKWCKRISENEARQIHPRLFEYLNEAERTAKLVKRKATEKEMKNEHGYDPCTLRP